MGTGSSGLAFGLDITATASTSSAFSQATADVRKYDAELKKLRQDLNGNAEASQKFAQTFLQAYQARERLRQVTSQLVQENGRLNETFGSGVSRVGAMVGELSALPGPAGQVASSFSNIASKATSMIGATGFVVLGFAAATAGALVMAKAVGDAAIQFANHVEHVQVLGLQTGLTSQQTERFDAAMKNMGLTVDSLTPSFRLLGTHIIDAIQKAGDARTAFQAVGVSVNDLRTKSQGEIFEQIIHGLGTIENQSVRTDTAVKLLGRSALSVLPLAGAAFDAAGAQAERVGLVLSESEKAIGESVDHSRDTIGRAREGMQQQAGILASILTDPFLKMEAKAAEGVAGVLKQLTTLAASSKAPLDTIATHAESVGETLLHVAARMAAVGGKLFGTITGVKSRDDLQQFVAGFDPMLAMLMGAKVTIKPPPKPDEPKMFGPFLSDDQAAAFAHQEELAQAAEKQLQATKDTIEQMNIRRALGAETVADEIQTLQQMEKQVLSARELLAIRKESAALMGMPEPGYSGSLTKTPFFKSELMGFSGMMQGFEGQALSGGANPMGKEFQAFGADAMKNLSESSAELKKRMEEIAAEMKIAGDSSSIFTALLATHQAQLGDAYLQGDVALQKYMGSLAQQAKAIERDRRLNAEVNQALLTGYRGVLHAFISGTENMGQIVGSIFEQMIQQILESAAAAGLASFFTSLIPGIGPVLSPVVAGSKGHVAAMGGTVAAMAGGGTLGMPFALAQHGLFQSGVTGKDTLPVMAQKGELFVSRRDTDDLRRFLDDQRRSRGRDDRPMTVNHVTVPVTVHTLMADKHSIRQACEETIVPEVVRALNGNSYRNP